MSKYFLGIDQGTTGVTAMLFDKDFAPAKPPFPPLSVSEWRR